MRNRDARSLLGAQWLAQAADGLVQATFANILILEPEGTPTRILAVSALTLVPYSLIAPFMGIFVDRWRRRTLLVWTNVVRGILLALIALLVQRGAADMALYGGLLVLLGLGRLFLTTKGAALPVVLHETQLLKGNSLSGGGGMIAALFGAVLGVGAVAVVDNVLTLFLGAAIYGASVYVASRITHQLGHKPRNSEQLRDAATRVLFELKDGAREVFSRADARIPLIGVTVVRTAAMVAAVSAIIIIKEQYPGAGEDLGRLSASGLALGTAGIGAFLAAATAPLLGRRFSEPGLIILGFVVSGAGIAALAGIDHMGAVLALTFVGGFGAFISKVAVDAQLQRALPDDFRGRGFAVYDILYNLATVAAAALVLAGDGDNFRTFLVGVGLVTLVLAGWIKSGMTSAGMFDRPVAPTVRDDAPPA